MPSILILDASDLDISLTTQLLEHVCLDTSPISQVYARSSKEALDILNSFHNAKGAKSKLYPNLILVDATIHGNEGLGFLSELESQIAKKELSPVKVIVISTSLENMEIINMFSCVVDFIKKPINLDKAKKIIEYV